MIFNFKHFQAAFENDTFFEIVTRKAVDEMRNFVSPPWAKNQNGEIFRIQKYQFVKTLMMTRNVINVQQTQTRSLLTIPGKMYIIDAVTENSGIMYADYFRVPLHWRFIREDLYTGDRSVKENKRKTRLQIVASIEWLKACIMKGKIETETHSNLKKYYEVVEKELHAEEGTYGRSTSMADPISDTHGNVQERKHVTRKVPDHQHVNNNSSTARGYNQEDINILTQRFQYRENLLTFACILLLLTMVFVTLAMFKISSTMSLLNERMIQIEQTNMQQSRHRDEFLKGLRDQTHKYNITNNI